MRQMQPVLWTKGVLLSPQHLQTQDRFLEDLIQFQLSGLTYCPWGFHRLEIDHEALAAGSFAISQAAGIFPDGLLFDLPLNDPAPAPKVLDGVWEQDQTALDIYLAVPEYRASGHNVAVSPGDSSARYAAEVLLRRDENTGSAEKPIQVAKKNFRLLVQGESLEGNSTLRVARVRRSATGDLSLDPQFVPPLIDIGASDFVIAIARRLVEILSARSSVLAGTRRQKNQSLADFSIADVASFWLLYTINTYFPQLRHLYETKRGHPEELFTAMLSLAGALTTFSTVVHPRDLPAYEHDDLTTCFAKLDEQLRMLLETVVPSNCVSLPLRLVQQSIYATALDQDKYLTAPQLYLAVDANMSPADLIQRAPALIKISSADRIDHLIRQALGGVPLTYTPNPPPAVPVKVSAHYFQVGKSGSEWDAITRARNLAAYVPSDFPSPQLELLVVLPPNR
ncbi:MAG TPA: type VI secretion system baseplate subunit TssK [Gemmatimonadaceae bacterium]|nr:type VI secretion system baseplate subunit TssK [Gemmatimonadaceae bacterium]